MTDRKRTRNDLQVARELFARLGPNSVSETDPSAAAKRIVGIAFDSLESDAFKFPDGMVLHPKLNVDA